MSDRDGSYPGERATAKQMAALADEYRAAAHVLLANRRPRAPLSDAPFRLAAVHAIELYLNALLVRGGHDPAALRKLSHGLGDRAKLATDAGLRLRQRTAEHLRRLDEERTYLTARYAADADPTGGQLNRIKATLDEVARKAAAPPPA